VTTLFPNFGFQANRRARSGPPADSGRNVIDLSSHLGRATEEAAEVELHAYVDCSLETGRRARMEAYLASHPEACVMAAAYRLLNIDLHRLFDRDLPPLTASLEALSQELERRLNALSSRETRKPDAVAHAGDVFHRAPLSSLVVVVSLIALAGLAWPLVAGQPGSCATRVEALAKATAKGRFAPELGERLAGAGRLCRAGDPDRAELALTRLEYETRRVGR
jgi:hypothetical protein